MFESFDPDLESETLTLEDDEDDLEEDANEIDIDREDRWVPKWKRSNCPKSDNGHNAIVDPIAAKFGHTVYVCQHCNKRNWTPNELEFIADALLRENANAELCRQCLAKDKNTLPYGKETGHIEWQLQKDENGDALLNPAGEPIYVGFPELVCDKNHKWYKGEGPRRNINGQNPILFEAHIYNRKRREIYPVEGVPDPAYTMDRWGKRPITGLYNRCVDVETRALTPTGWVTYKELSKGDLIRAYDIQSNSCDWLPLLEDPFINENYQGSLQVLESKDISARVTEGHKWVVSEDNGVTRYQVTSYFDKLTHKSQLTQFLCKHHQIPVLDTMLNGENWKWVNIFASLGGTVFATKITVWCPRVESGFWMAKRNGKVYVTGNTHPEGRKTNSKEQRRNGSGFYK